MTIPIIPSRNFFYLTFPNFRFNPSSYGPIRGSWLFKDNDYVMEEYYSFDKLEMLRRRKWLNQFDIYYEETINHVEQEYSIHVPSEYFEVLTISRLKIIYLSEIKIKIDIDNLEYICNYSTHYNNDKPEALKITASDHGQIYRLSAMMVKNRILHSHSTSTPHLFKSKSANESYITISFNNIKIMNQ